MNKIVVVVCASIAIGCGSTSGLSSISQEERDARCNAPGINDFPVEALVEYSFAEDMVFDDGRERAFVATVLVHACTDIDIIAPMLTFIQEEEAEQSPQDQDDATGIYVDSNETPAFSGVTPVGDNDQNLEGDLEPMRNSDEHGGFKTVLRDAIPMHAGEARFISFKVSITRNPALVGSMQKFTMFPEVIYRSASGVCAVEGGCAPNSEPIGTAPTLTVRYQ